MLRRGPQSAQVAAGMGGGIGAAPYSIPTGGNTGGYRMLNLTGYTILVYQEDDSDPMDFLPAWTGNQNRFPKNCRALRIESPAGQTPAAAPKSSLLGIIQALYYELLPADVAESLTPTISSWPS